MYLFVLFSSVILRFVLYGCLWCERGGCSNFGAWRVTFVKPEVVVRKSELAHPVAFFFIASLIAIQSIEASSLLVITLETSLSVDPHHEQHQQHLATNSRKAPPV
jgi:hypothetical protein